MLYKIAVVCRTLGPPSSFGALGKCLVFLVVKAGPVCGTNRQLVLIATTTPWMSLSINEPIPQILWTKVVNNFKYHKNDVVPLMLV